MRKGQALIISYLLVAAFAALSGALMFNAVNEKNISYRNKLAQEAFYLAEGATENAISQFATAMANYQIATDVASYNVTTNYTTFTGATAIASTVTRRGTSDTDQVEGSTTIKVRNYIVETTVTHPATASLPAEQKVTVTLKQSISRRIIYTFQHGVFYDGDLEVLPGANMTFLGWIHSNSDIYIGSESGKTLTVDSTYLHSSGNIYNKRKDSNNAIAGSVSIKVDDGGSNFLTMKLADNSILDSSNPNWTADSQTRWLGTVQSSVHGVTKLAPPSVASIQPDGYYADNADVVITNGTIVKGGVTLSEGTVNDTDKTNKYPPGTIATTTTFYNNREGKYVTMTVIDMNNLAGNVTVPEGKPPFPNNLPSDTNNLMYMTRNDAGANQPGVKIINGSKIYGRTNGVTIVSNDPVYLKGNFNTQLDNGTAGRKPAGIICDSVNLLSNNWSSTDANSTGNVSTRVATETTYNCAFIAGVKTTTTGNYNGGLENYPRLHETWSGINLRITGSFVSLWNSTIATGSWVYGNPQYTAPTRIWTYDSNFNTDSGRPRYTPFVIEARRVAWWKE